MHWRGMARLSPAPRSHADTTRAAWQAASFSGAAAGTHRGKCERTHIRSGRAPFLTGNRPRSLSHTGAAVKVCRWHLGSHIDMTHIAFIGGGNMARSLIGGLLKTGMPAANLRVAEPLAQARESLGRDFGVATFDDNRLAAEGA